jgi:hypothetical protein
MRIPGGFDIACCSFAELRFDRKTDGREEIFFKIVLVSLNVMMRIAGVCLQRRVSHDFLHSCATDHGDLVEQFNVRHVVVGMRE